jgi:hypothetical protein
MQLFLVVLGEAEAQILLLPIQHVVSLSSEERHTFAFAAADPIGDVD